MPLKIGSSDITAIYNGNIPLTAVYLGSELMWSAVKNIDFTFDSALQIIKNTKGTTTDSGITYTLDEVLNKGILGGNSTVVGSPVITSDCVASGFSTSSYLTYQATAVDTVSTFEMVLHYNTGPLTVSRERILCTKNWPDGSLILETASKTTINFYNYFDGALHTIAVTSSLQAYTDYWYKLVYSSSDSTMLVYNSTDSGETWSLIKTVSSYSMKLTSDVYEIGQHALNSNNVCYGYIYLKDSYIKVNGEPWIAPLDPSTDLFEGYATTSNYTTVGSPTITNNIATSFGSSSYIKAPKEFDPLSATWEIGMKFKINTSSPTDWNPLFDSISANSSTGVILWTYSQYLCAEVQISGTKYTLTSGTDPYLEYDTYYYVKLVYTGSELKLYASKNKDITEEDLLNYRSLTGSINSGYPWIGKEQLWGASYYYVGAIDLSECYVKIGGAPWWAPVYDAYSQNTKSTSNTLYLANRDGETTFTCSGSGTPKGFDNYYNTGHTVTLSSDLSTIESFS